VFGGRLRAARGYRGRAPQCEEHRLASTLGRRDNKRWSPPDRPSLLTLSRSALAVHRMTAELLPEAGSTPGAYAGDRGARMDGPDSRQVWLPRRIRRLGWCLLVLQLVGLLAWSQFTYSRFGLSRDFSFYAQGWWSIAHGHLNPVSADFGVSFLKNAAEVVLWPLALLYFLWPHAVDLLWAQDVAIVAAGYVAWRWALEVLEDRPRVSDAMRAKIAAGVVVMLLIDPWAYLTAAYDFHTEPLGALFAILLARGLWRGTSLKNWAWAFLTALCGAVPTLYIIGIGIGALVGGRRSRRSGAVLAGMALGYLLVLGALGADGTGGQNFPIWYGYLTGKSAHVGPLNVLVGLLRHPLAAAQMALSRVSYIVGYLLAGGLVGVASPWAAGLILAVLVPNALNSTPIFILPFAAFQNWALIPVLLVGTVMVIARLADPGRRNSMARALGAVALAGCIALAGGEFPTLIRDYLPPGSRTAAALRAVEAQSPPTVEVVASEGVVGRFGERDAVYGIQGAPERIGLAGGRSVVFILVPGHGGHLSSLQVQAQVRFVQGLAGARPLVASAGVHAFRWMPPPNISSVTLP